LLGRLARSDPSSEAAGFLGLPAACSTFKEIAQGGDTMDNQRLAFPNLATAYEAWFELRLRLLALSECLNDAGVISRAQVDQKIEELRKSALQHLSDLERAHLEAWNPDKKGPPQ
jgi:hypothetical protein